MKTGLQFFVYAVCMAVIVCASSAAFALAGDSNADGKINSRDVAAIQKHILQMQRIDAENLEAADFNNDGKINSRDVSKLQKYVLIIENTVGPLPTATPVPTPDFTLDRVR